MLPSRTGSTAPSRNDQDAYIRAREEGHSHSVGELDQALGGWGALEGDEDGDDDILAKPRTKSAGAEPGLPPSFCFSSTSAEGGGATGVGNHDNGVLDRSDDEEVDSGGESVADDPVDVNDAAEVEVKKKTKRGGVKKKKGTKKTEMKNIISPAQMLGMMVKANITDPKNAERTSTAEANKINTTSTTATTPGAAETGPSASTSVSGGAGGRTRPAHLPTPPPAPALAPGTGAYEHAVPRPPTPKYPAKSSPGGEGDPRYALVGNYYLGYLRVLKRGKQWPVCQFWFKDCELFSKQNKENAPAFAYCSKNWAFRGDPDHKRFVAAREGEQDPNWENRTLVRFRMQIMQKSNLELRPQAEDVEVLTREEYENYLRQEAEDQEPEVAQHPAQTGAIDHQQITHGQHNMGVVQNNTTTSNGSTAASENQNHLYNNRDAACGATTLAQGTAGNTCVAPETHQRGNCGTAPSAMTTTQQYNYHTNNSQQSASSSINSYKNPALSNSSAGGDRIITPMVHPVVTPWGVDTRAEQNTATNGGDPIGQAAMAQQADLGASWVEQGSTNPYNTEGSTYTNGNGWEEMHHQQQTPWPEAESSSSAPEQVAHENCRSAHENGNRCWDQVQQQQATALEQQWTITSTAVHLTGGGDHTARGDEQSGDALSQTQPPPPPDRSESMDQSLVENPGAQMNSAVARMYSNPYNSAAQLQIASAQASVATYAHYGGHSSTTQQNPYSSARPRQEERDHQNWGAGVPNGAGDEHQPSHPYHVANQQHHYNGSQLQVANGTSANKIQTEHQYTGASYYNYHPRSMTMQHNSSYNNIAAQQASYGDSQQCNSGTDDAAHCVGHVQRATGRASAVVVPVHRYPWQEQSEVDPSTMVASEQHDARVRAEDPTKNSNSTTDTSDLGAGEQHHVVGYEITTTSSTCNTANAQNVGTCSRTLGQQLTFVRDQIRKADANRKGADATANRLRDQCEEMLDTMSETNAEIRRLKDKLAELEDKKKKDNKTFCDLNMEMQDQEKTGTRIMEKMNNYKFEEQELMRKIDILGEDHQLVRPRADDHACDVGGTEVGGY
ncbi:unnamed protein product [Amoebophrya sp. A120]|nr:unnamed protein product [Amoebophrya sp. A120]|eukprot:GSA120T00002556001.1